MAKVNGVRTQRRTASKAAKMLKNARVSKTSRSLAGSSLVNRKKRT